MNSVLYSGDLLHIISTVVTNLIIAKKFGIITIDSQLSRIVKTENK